MLQRDRLDGDAGNDVLIGGLGRDTITGGAGEDLVIVTPLTDGADVVDLGSGQDTVLFQGDGSDQSLVQLSFDAQAIGNGDAYRNGSLAVEVFSQDFNYTRTSPVSRYDDEGTTFTAGENTYIVIFDGFDRGAAVKIAAFGSVADETFDYRGWGESVYLAGGDGDDTLVGGYSNDFLRGGSGSDRLECFAGFDFMTGGEGADTFVFSGSPFGGDLRDFETGVDKIDLTAFGITLDDVTIDNTSDNLSFVTVDINFDGSYDFYFYVENTQAVQSDFLF